MLTCFEWAIAASCMAGTISEVFCTCLHARTPDSCQTQHSPARHKYIHNFLAGFADGAAGATHTCFYMAMYCITTLLQILYPNLVPSHHNRALRIAQRDPMQPPEQGQLIEVIEHLKQVCRSRSDIKIYWQARAAARVGVGSGLHTTSREL